MADARERPNLRDEERNLIAQWLLQNNHNNELRYGAKKEASILFHVDPRTIYRIWKVVQSQKTQHKVVHVVSMKKGCKHVSRQKILDEDKVRNLSFQDRTSIRKLSSSLGVTVGLTHKWIKGKQLKAHTSAIKPFLTEPNKIARLKWSLSMLSCISQNGRIKFQSMYNIIHVDEKWFNLTRTSQRYYVLADEEGPHRTCKSKTHIEKIMFISVVGRPQTNVDGKIIFDAKFGIFPLVFTEPAQKNSKNRDKGTMVTKAIPAITKPVMKEYFIQQVVLVLKAKWPQGMSRNIIIEANILY